MSKFIKAPYVTVGIQKECLYLGFGSIQQEIKDPSLHKTILKILNAFTVASTWQDVEVELSGEHEFIKCAEIIKNGRYLIEDGIYDREDRFSRAKLFYNMQGFDPTKSQEKLYKSKIGVIGCGGIGNLVSVNLATAGVGKFLLCDNDEVEASNLSRQIMFTESDLGLLKSTQLAKSLKQRASYVEVESLNKKILSVEDLTEFKDFDLLVVSADKGNVVSVVNEFSVKYKVPYINVGYVNDIAVWGPLVIPGETGCYRCQDIVAGFGQDESITQLVKNINSDYQAPSVGPVNMLSSSLASLDIVRFLVGEGEIQSLNKRIGLWTHNMKLEIQECHKNIKCKVCS